MNFETLMTPERAIFNVSPPSIPPHDSLLNNYQKDPDRILFSSAFRRMQGKAQVFIFPPSDYVRNRLTHTLECVNIGRLLIGAIFKRSPQKSAFRSACTKIGELNIADVVAAACMAHDIGNPPFGHIGEYAMRSWYQDHLERNDRPRLQELLSSDEEKRNDFLYFEGNAQGFRIVTTLQGWPEQNGGLQLTYATLGAFIKYPHSSKYKTDKHKYGFFYSEHAKFDSCVSKLGLKESNGRYCRHPLAYVMEAADDIAYHLSDIEDSTKANLIDVKTVVELLHEVAKKSELYKPERFDVGGSGDPLEKVKFLRSAATVALVSKLSETFVDQIENILAGNFDGSLIDRSASVRSFIETIRKICRERVYYNEEKVIRETGAYECMRYLLSIFSEMGEELITKGSFEKMTNERNRNLHRILQASMRADFIGNNAYEVYQRINDFLSGMTDRYAIDLSSRISGQALRLVR